MTRNLVFWELGEDTRVEIIPGYTDGRTHHPSLAIHVIVISFGGRGVDYNGVFWEKDLHSRREIPTEIPEQYRLSWN
jgi:hypothetical protein